MFRPKTKLLLALAAAACLAQSPSVGLLTPDVKRVGSRLACLCGACKNTLGDCPMLECHYARPGREKIAVMQSGGAGDDAIVDSFVKETGRRALAAPPTEGFHLLAWLTPFAAIGAGLLLIWWFIRKYRAPAAQTADSSEIPRDVLDRIEKDLAKLD